MTIRLKQSTASQEVPLGYFVDDTDGKTAETGLTIANTDIKLWLMGATSLANKNSGGATHMAGGLYYCVLDATDTATLGALIIFVHVAGALPVRVECEVLAANVYDSLVAGSDKLEVDAVQFGGTNGTFSSGRPEVNASHWGGTAVASAVVGANMLQISGDATAADTLEAALDGTAGAVPAFGIIDQGTAQAATGTTLQLRAGAAFADDEIIGAVVVITGGSAGVGQSRVVTDYAGATDTATVDAWTTTPTGTITYQVFAGPPSDGALLAAINTRASQSSVDTIDGIVDAILVDTAEIGAAGAGLTALASAANLATVDTVVDAILVDTAEIGAAGAGLTALASAANLATVAGYIDTEVGTIITNLAVVDGIADSLLVIANKLDDTLEDDGGTYRFTANALEEAPAGGGGFTVQDIVDGVWDESIASHAGVGSTGAALAAAGGSGDPWATALPGAYGAGTAGQIVGDYIDAAISGISGGGLDAAGVRAAIGLASANLDTQIGTLATAANLATVATYLDTEVAAILADTNELQTDWANGGRLDLILDARASQSSVDDLPTNAELATALSAADDAVLTAVADLPTNAELATALAAADDAVLSAVAGVAASVADLPTSADLATALDALPTPTENADALLNRDMSAVDDTNARSPLNALRHIRNKWDTTSNPGYVTVRKEDDTTEAWRAALATDGSAQPITGSDPT